MASPTQLNIVLSGSGGTVTIPIPASLQALDSGQLASTQTGFNAADTMVRNIMRGGGFWDSSNTVFRPISQIESITYS